MLPDEEKKMKGVLGMYSPENIFSLSYGSYFGGSCAISIVRNNETEDLCAITGGNGYPEETEFPVEKDSIYTLNETLEKIKQWNNNYDCPHDILDGFGWEVSFVSEGKKVRKSGYMAYPENYNEVMQDLLRFVEEHKKAALTGKEIYLPLNPFEREGFFVPIGEKTCKEEHYRRLSFRPKIRLWSWKEQIYK